MSTIPAIRVWESSVAVIRRVWKTNVVLNLLQPLLYLLGMGLGVGSLINSRQSATDSLGGVPYIAFLAPGLLATTAMIVAYSEASYPTMDGFRWSRAFEAMAATPITARHIVRGQMLFWLTRTFISVAAVAVILTIFQDTRSTGLLLAVPVATVSGLAFATPVAAYAATLENDVSFSTMQRFIITPLFLFGGAFYPVSSLPSALRPIAYATPLWHTVEICRGLSLHTLGLSSFLGHAAVVTAFIVAGWLWCNRTFTRRLYA